MMNWISRHFVCIKGCFYAFNQIVDLKMFSLLNQMRLKSNSENKVCILAEAAPTMEM